MGNAELYLLPEEFLMRHEVIFFQRFRPGRNRIVDGSRVLEQGGARREELEPRGEFALPGIEIVS